MTAANPAVAPVLEVETGLQQLMGDHDLYRQILRRFRQRYQDSAEQARTELLAGDIVSAQRTVHTLKGAAGMIGAQQLYQLSMALEPLFAGPPAPCIGPLAQLELAVRALMVAIDAELADALVAPATAAAATATAAAATAAVAPAATAAKAAMTGATAAAGPPPEIGPLVKHLARLLEEGDGAAIDVLEQSASVLAAGLGEEAFQEVTEAAHQFDFEAALAILGMAQEKLSA
ncbi:two-component system sensor histidine kinase/response regulator [Duganella sp. 3397]|uniref:Hpt domain-containing protein n=1 Tax=Duganella sp. 3397 TaxID=2817732 RepID=UPI0028623B1F|nr:Hpt domain-containing protein [Duganella sp. 3397]MDR7047579.1 two-component system sensor histidine kinase/response regulator [Duganella sp. 3397]